MTHYVFDWGLQSRWMGENKSECVDILIAHCVIYTAGITALLVIIGEYNIWKIAFISIGHFAIDGLTSRLHKKIESKNEQLTLLRIDHILHFIQLWIIL